jgi:hypothetical protein
MPEPDFFLSRHWVLFVCSPSSPLDLLTISAHPLLTFRLGGRSNPRTVERTMVRPKFSVLKLTWPFGRAAARF